MASTDSVDAAQKLGVAKVIPISQLNPELRDSSTHSVRGVVTIVWPYNSVTGSIAFILAEPEFRLRLKKGQIRVNFSGPSGKAVSECGLGGTDEVILSLDGAEWETDESNNRMPGTGLGWQLKFSGKALLQVKSGENGQVQTLDVDQPVLPETEPQRPPASIPQVQVDTTTLDLSPVLGTTVNSLTPAKSAPLRRLDDGEYESPAFIKRARVSYGSLFEGGLDIFEEDGSVRGRGRKRTRFGKDSSAWRYSSQSPSPERSTEPKEDFVEARVNTPSSPLRPETTDEGVQTMELDIPASAPVAGGLLTAEHPNPFQPAGIPNPFASSLVDQGHQTFRIGGWDSNSSYMYSGALAHDQENPAVFRSNSDPNSVDHFRSEWNAQPIENHSVTYPDLPSNDGQPNGLVPEHDFGHGTMTNISSAPGFGYVAPDSQAQSSPQIGTSKIDTYGQEAGVEEAQNDYPILPEEATNYPPLETIEDASRSPHTPQVMPDSFGTTFPAVNVSLPPETVNVPANPFAREGISTDRAAMNAGTPWAAVNDSRSNSQSLANRLGSNDGQTPESALVIDESDSESESEDSIPIDPMGGRPAPQLEEGEEAEDAEFDDDVTAQYPDDDDDDEEEEYDEYDEDIGGDYDIRGYLGPDDDEDDRNDVDLRPHRLQPEFDDHEGESWDGDEEEYEEEYESEYEMNDEAEQPPPPPPAQQQPPSGPPVIDLISSSEDEDDDDDGGNNDSAIQNAQRSLELPGPAVAAGSSPNYGPKSDHESEGNESEDEVEMDSDVYGEELEHDQQDDQGSDDLYVNGVDDEDENEDEEIDGDIEVERLQSEARSEVEQLDQSNILPEDSQRDALQAASAAIDEQFEVRQPDEVQKEDEQNGAQLEKLQDGNQQVEERYGNQSDQEQNVDGLNNAQDGEQQLEDQSGDHADDPDGHRQLKPFLSQHIDEDEVMGDIEPEEAIVASDNIRSPINDVQHEGQNDKEVDIVTTRGLIRENTENSLDGGMDNDIQEVKPGLAEDIIQKEDMPALDLRSQQQAENHADSSMVIAPTSPPLTQYFQSERPDEMQDVQIQEAVTVVESQLPADQLPTPMDTQPKEKSFTQESAVIVTMEIDEVGTDSIQSLNQSFQVVTETSAETNNADAIIKSTDDNLMGQHTENLENLLNDDPPFSDHVNGAAQPSQSGHDVTDVTPNVIPDGTGDDDSEEIFVKPGSPPASAHSEALVHDEDVISVTSSIQSQMGMDDALQAAVLKEDLWRSQLEAQELANQGQLTSRSQDATSELDEEYDLQDNVPADSSPILGSMPQEEHDEDVVVAGLEQPQLNYDLEPHGEENDEDDASDWDPSVQLAEIGIAASRPARPSRQGSPQHEVTPEEDDDNFSDFDPSVRLAKAGISPPHPSSRSSSRRGRSRAREAFSESIRPHTRSSTPHSPISEAADQSVRLAETSFRTPSKIEVKAAEGKPESQTPLTSPTSSKLEEETTSVTASKLKLVRHLRDELPDQTTLKVLRQHNGKAIDVMALAMMSPADPQRAKGGPREYMMSFTVTDHTIFPNAVIEVQLYRPHKESLPKVKAGDVVLLRHFTIQAMKGKGYGLRTNDGSSWAVFDKEDAPAQIKGPPVEYGEAESTYAVYVRDWSRLLDDKAKQKLEKANKKIIEAGRPGK